MDIRQSQRSSSQGISSGEHEQEIWRDKYFSTLDELEHEQKTANAAIDVLRRGLLSVSLAGDGLDADLDDKLTKLRGQLKTAKDYPSLSKLLQNIETDLIRLDTRKLENTKTQKSHTGEALSLLLKSSLDPEIKQELKVFQKKIKASEHDSDLARQFETDLITLLLPLLTELSKEYADKNPTGGLWDRFRKSVSSAQQNSEVMLEAEPAVNVKVEAKVEAKVEGRIDQITDSKSTNNQDPEGNATQAKESDVQSNKPVSDSIKDSGIKDDSKIPLLKDSKSFVSKLLESVYDNSSLARIAKALSKEVSAADATALLASYPKTLNLLDLVQTQRMKAFLDYLSEINFSLAKVSKSISTSKATQQEIKSRGKTQNQKLRGGIDKIRIILNTSTDLENLKSQTQDQLDAIVQSLDKSSETTEQSEQELTNLGTKQSAELASAVEKTKNINKTFKMTTNTSEDPEVDQLTKLKNQGALVKELKSTLATHKKRQQRLCLCIGDVRALQAINDEYGRNVGDKALELLAKEIESKSKTSDILAYGDNGRFILLKPVTELDAANTQIDSLSSDLAKLPFRFKGNEVKVQLTFATQQSTLNDTATSLLEKVEQALEKAKLSSSAAMPLATATAETKAT